MNIQRDVDPENDKKLDKMLDAKFGKRGRTIVKGATVRTLTSLVKRVIKARKQFGDTVFNKPQGQKVGKHGSHDQSTHAPKGKSRRGMDFTSTQSQAERNLSHFISREKDPDRRASLEAELRRLRNKKKTLKVSKLTIDEARERADRLRERRQSGGRTKVFKIDKHGSHDQSTHSPTGRRGQITDPKERRRLNLPTNDERKVLIFAAKYPKGWHSYAQDKATRSAVEAVARRGDLEISRETNQFRLKRRKRKVTKRSVNKHGTHDQRTHSPTGRAAIAQERVKPQVKPEGPSSPAPLKVKLRVKLQSAMKDVDAILDGLDTGTRVYAELKEAKEAIQARLRERREERKVTKFEVVRQAIEKGIGHSLEILTNAIRLIGVQEPDAEISEADEKKLQEIIDEILGVAGYLDTVKEQGYFEKGEAPVPDSSASYRPSFTTPAVAREQKRQRTEPNAKGRGESTARAPGY